MLQLGMEDMVEFVHIIYTLVKMYKPEVVGLKE